MPALLPKLRTKDFLSVTDLSAEELAEVLELAATFKLDRHAGRSHGAPLAGQHVAILFDKPSLRTRSTFVIAMRELGGEVIEPTPDVTFAGRESVEDVARNLERWVTGAVVRTFGHARLAQFASASSRLHVVNALTDDQHPCQALADMQTLIERFGDVRGRTIAYVGDGNNVAVSLSHAAMLLGMHMRMATPAGYELPPAVVAEARRLARHGATLTESSDPIEAVRGVDAVYTDSWVSMGQEAETAIRHAVFGPYQVNAALMEAAGPQAIFMHCLPAHRGHEVTDEIMDSPASVVFDQSENRLHTQKALLAALLAT